MGRSRSTWPVDVGSVLGTTTNEIGLVKEPRLEEVWDLCEGTLEVQGVGGGESEGAHLSRVELAELCGVFDVDVGTLEEVKLGLGPVDLTLKLKLYVLPFGHTKLSDDYISTIDLD